MKDKSDYKYVAWKQFGTWNITVRNDDWSDLVLDMEAANTQLEIKPTATPTPAQTTTDVCPICGSPLVVQTTKTGKSVQKCSTNKWDPIRKEATGCKYVKWL